MPNVLDLKNPQPSSSPQDGSAPVRLSGGDPVMGIVPGFAAGVEPVEWEASSRAPGQSRYRRYLLFAAFVLVGGLLSWWQSSGFIFVTVVLGLAAWELHERMGKPVHVRIDSTGVSLDNHHFPHSELASFDLHRMADESVVLSLATTRWHSAHMRIPLAGQDPVQVREALLSLVPEERHGVGPVDWFITRG